MKKTLLFLALCYLAIADNGAVRADERPRPSLMITREQLANAKKLIESREWATELYRKVGQTAESRDSAGYLPGSRQEGIHVAQGLVYQIEGDKAMAARARDHLLAVARRFKPGEGSYPWGISANLPVVYDLIAEACTADERREIEDYLRGLANDAIEWKKTGPATPNMSFVCHWTVGLAGYAIGDKDIIDWALHDDPTGRTAYGGLFPVMESALRDKRLWHEAPVYADHVFQGMLIMAQAAKNSQGTDLYDMPAKNGATICKIVEGLFSMAYPIEWTGIPGGSIRQVTWGDGSTRSPVSGNDQNSGFIDPFYVNKPDARPADWNLYHSFTIANHLQPDPRYEWLLGRNARHDEALGWFCWFPWALFHTDLNEKAPESPPAMPSVVYPEMGLAILRADESPTYWRSGKPVLVHQTGELYGHRNYDYMQIMLFANGRLLYHSPEQRPYVQVGFAPQRFNKVVVDKRPNTDTGKSRQRYEFSPDVKFLTNTATGLNPGVTEVRSLFLTDQYAADFYDLMSDSEHTYDWFIHAIGKGRLTHESLYTRSSDFATDYPWIEHERKWETDGAVRMDFTQRAAGVMKGIGSWTDTWFDGFAGVRMTLLGEPDTTAYGCDDLFSDHEVAWGRRHQSTPTFCARRSAGNTTFVALHEPHSKSPKLSVGRFGRDSQAHAIRIVGPDFVDVVCTAFDDGKATHVLRDAAGTERVAFQNYAWIRIAKGKVLARGGIRSCLLLAPEVAGERALVVNGKSESYARAGDYLAYHQDSPQNHGLTVSAAGGDIPHCVGPGETFKLTVVAANRGNTHMSPQSIEPVVPEGWKAAPRKTEVNLQPGESHRLTFEATVPTTSKAGSVHDMEVMTRSVADAKPKPFSFPVGRVAVTRPVVLKFDSECARVPKNTKGTVTLTVSNPTGYAVRGAIRLATTAANAKVDPAKILFGPIVAGQSGSYELAIRTGDKNELGELKAELMRVELVGQDDVVVLPLETVGVPAASLLVSVGVTIAEDVRHKLKWAPHFHYPVWIVRSPTYEIWFSQKDGLARTMFDSTGRSIYAYPWGPSGLCRFSRVVKGVYREVHVGGVRPKSMHWQGTTLVCESQYGDQIRIECTEHHVHWHMSCPQEQFTGPGYRMNIEAFFAHPPSFSAVHSDSDTRPADWPAKVGPLSYSVIHQPGYSTDSIWIAATEVVPRCAMSDPQHNLHHVHSGVAVGWNWLKKPEFDVYIGVAPVQEVLHRIKKAAATVK